MWQEPDYPQLPPLLKYIKSPVVLVLPRCIREFINAAWYIISSTEPLRYERLALAYHGFYLGDFFEPDSGFRVRQIEQRGSERLSVAKRVTDAFQSEVDILRLLSSKAMEGPRNHTTVPTHILWGQRIYVTPFYHESYANKNSPNAVLNLAKQVTEAVAFLHEHRIAHMDISPSNFLLAWSSALGKPRLLVADFELAVLFSNGEDPIVNIWDRFLTPPEGKTAINAFAFDMYCVGSFFMSYLQDCVLERDYPDIIWPDSFMKLYEGLRDKRPEVRPTAREAEMIMQTIDEDQMLSYSGGVSSSCTYDFSKSIRLHPTLSSDTPLPAPSDFNTESLDW